MRTALVVIGLVALLLLLSTAYAGDAALESRLSDLENRLDASGIAFVLFGAFCALWAQNTGRNPWLWFFLGLVFNVVTVFVLLWKNSRDRVKAGR
jgi:cell division protein FtsW (lipid II flippase)